MRATLLPAARDLSAQENAQLAAADQRATGVPYAALAVAPDRGRCCCSRAQFWLARRTSRILNPGLLVASVVGLASLIWLVTALTVARTHLIAARDHGSAPVEALARAETAALQAHADESLTLIDRSGDDSFQADFLSLQRAGPGAGHAADGRGRHRAGQPGRAAGRGRVTGRARLVRRPSAGTVTRRHRAICRRGPAGPRCPADSGYRFGRLDTDLTGAIAADQASFRSAAQQGRDDLAFLEAGMIVLSLVMAASCAWAISRRRLAEYR